MVWREETILTYSEARSERSLCITGLIPQLNPQFATLIFSRGVWIVELIGALWDCLGWGCESKQVCWYFFINHFVSIELKWLYWSVYWLAKLNDNAYFIIFEDGQRMIWTVHHIQVIVENWHLLQLILDNVCRHIRNW